MLNERRCEIGAEMKRTLGIRSVALFISVAAMASAIGIAEHTAAENVAAPNRRPAALSGTITVWDPNLDSFEGYTTATEQLDAAFTEETGVEVEHIAQPFGEYDQLLQAAFAGGSVPDVMLLVPGSQGVLRWTDGLEELSADVADIRAELSYWESANPDLEQDGPVYGVPIGTQADVFYYNKQLFTDAGLDPESPPTTFDEMVAAADALLAAGIQPFASGNKEGYENQWWLSVLWAGLFDVEQTQALARGEIKFTDQQFVDVIERYQQLNDAGYFGDARFSTPLFPDGVDSFSNGEGAMFLGLSDVAAHYGVFNEALGVENVGIFEAPGIASAEALYLPVTATYVWSIPTDSDNKDAALAYIRFMASTESQQVHYEVANSFPNNSNVVLQGAPPQLVAMAEDYQSATTFQSAHQVIPGVVLTEWTNVINEVLQGRMTIDEGLEQINDVAERA